jgi:hypothetical protein
MHNVVYQSTLCSVVCNKLECQKEVVVCIEKCYRSIGMLEGSGSAILSNDSSQLECQDETVATY